ncbi:hypothetical protein Y032_0083g1630 [Ancylostoma ceylanicum]|uniref:Uncharacterized protein n=1 Tax=Ancylostoma ceylanicum TaxID=53326 RepID=A0A016TQ79_9BILA|nr:hypothetical protein Y032_0083g1630 [Ancylostoma ceylanicum]
MSITGVIRDSFEDCEERSEAEPGRRPRLVQQESIQAGGIDKIAECKFWSTTRNTSRIRGRQSSIELMEEEAAVKRTTALLLQRVGDSKSDNSSSEATSRNQRPKT